jgi:hypothetical protein
MQVFPHYIVVLVAAGDRHLFYVLLSQSCLYLYSAGNDSCH